MATIPLVLALLTGSAALAWTGLALRLLSRLDAYRPLSASADPTPRDAPPVDVVVPAHNEERDIESTVTSILAQDYPALHLTVIDDQSVDATGAIVDRLEARQREAPVKTHLLRVIHGVERPEGWVGKTWALHQGVADARAEWLLFVDGDIHLHPEALPTAWRKAEETGADLVSFLARPACDTFWQGTIAVSFMQVLAQLFPLDRVNDPRRAEAIAAGGFILVRRSVYERAGGHQGVRREIIEDIQLARRIKGVGGRLSVHLAPDLVWTHMYGGFGDIWRGLRKNAYAGMDYQFHKYVVGTVVALLMAWAPPVALAWGLLGLVFPLAAPGGPALWIGLGLWGWLAQALASAPMLRYLRLSAPFAFSLPAGITAYVAIATASVWHHHRGRVLWKERVYSARTVNPP